MTMSKNHFQECLCYIETRLRILSLLHTARLLEKAQRHVSFFNDGGGVKAETDCLLTKACAETCSTCWVAGATDVIVVKHGLGRDAIYQCTSFYVHVARDNKSTLRGAEGVLVYVNRSRNASLSMVWPLPHRFALLHCQRHSPLLKRSPGCWGRAQLHV